MSGSLHVVGHPLIQHKLTQMRRKETETRDFRRLAREIALLLAYEVTRDRALTTLEIETPLQKMRAPALAGKEICLVSVLRAGNGILDGMLEILPSARVGFVGLYRDPETLAAVEYYCKLPEDIGERETIVVDPMLATGHSASAAVGRIKQAGAKSIEMAFRDLNDAGGVAGCTIKTDTRDSQTQANIAVDAATGRTITLKSGGRELSFGAVDYVNRYVFPNFYFHLTMVYALLRQAGVPIGKGDFLGS